MKNKKEANLAIVKWAGGKRQLLKQFKPFFPKKINRYFEPFVGGGAVALYIIKNHSPKQVFLSDVNEELINVYENVKNNLTELIELLKKFQKKHSQKVYYDVRDEDIELLSKVSSAARFIYLNKTCFNGLYRVNSKGKFNVPIGSYKNPQICAEKDLKEISKLLQKTKIEAQPFEKVLSKTKKGDFIYLDPPYFPLNKSSFTKYSKGDFLEEEQKKLFNLFKKLDEKGCNVMLSNSDSTFIKKLYKDYKINFVKATRMINCNALKRGAVKEVVITNY